MVITCPVCKKKREMPPSYYKRLRRGQPTCSKACRAKLMRGKGHWNWRGGRTMNGDRVRVLNVATGKYEYESRLKAARRLRRPLKPNEIVRADGRIVTVQTSARAKGNS